MQSAQKQACEFYVLTKCTKFIPRLCLVCIFTKFVKISLPLDIHILSCYTKLRTFVLVLFLKGDALMHDWLSYLETYRSNRNLYESVISGRQDAKSECSPEKARLAEKLRASVLEAEQRLENYISSDLSPREAAMQADEKLFLSYRYIYGMTMMETAYAMSVSRDTVYRIRRRILSRKFPY